MSSASQFPHRRYNPLRRQWVLVSPHRTERPWQGEVNPSSGFSDVHYDPNCYLCPGNKRAGGHVTPKYDSVFIFDNDYAALLPDSSAPEADPSPLLRAERERGRCRVICFHPDHSLTLARMDVPAIRKVVDAWTEECEALGREPDRRYVQIFENRGAMMGASNPHPHCQIWATHSIPEAPARELAAQRDYHEDESACLLCDYLALEHKQEQRIVYENADFTAMAPFWAVWPFEILVCSRRHLDSLLDLSEEEVSNLSELLKHITSTYDRVFDVPFPYSMGFHQAPTDNAAHPEWHFHAHFYPPLLRSATVRKFMVGFEMLATPQRDITPEIAAERLRSLSARG